LAVILAAVLAIAPVGALAADAGSAPWLFLKLSEQASAESSAAAKAGHAADAKTWAAWSQIYRQDVVSPNVEGKSAVQITDELERSNRAALSTAHDPRAAALDRASADFWRRLHDELATGAPLVIAFPKREMLTPIAGLQGTPWQAGVNATASDCASLAERARACEAQAAEMQRENASGLYGDRSFPLLMQEHQCHKWEEMHTAYCPRH
jgi:hypothetical protein